MRPDRTEVRERAGDTGREVSDEMLVQRWRRLGGVLRNKAARETRFVDGDVDYPSAAAYRSENFQDSAQRVAFMREGSHGDRAVRRQSMQRSANIARDYEFGRQP